MSKCQICQVNKCHVAQHSSTSTKWYSRAHYPLLTAVFTCHKNGSEGFFLEDRLHGRACSILTGANSKLQCLLNLVTKYHPWNSDVFQPYNKIWPIQMRCLPTLWLNQTCATAMPLTLVTKSDRCNYYTAELDTERRKCGRGRENKLSKHT